MKRAISVFLAILLIAMNIPFAAGASNTVPSNADGALMDNDLKISSTNSLGNLFMEPINGRQEQLEENNGCNVFSVEILGKTAFVTYETLEKATLVVAIYDEDDLQMLASGSILVSEEETEATVTIDADTMPQYFRVRAYLIEPETLRPLCTEYTSPLYTREMQELISKTTDDFDTDKVLNLDEDTTNNFAVYSDDTVVIPQSDTANIVASVDEENSTYVIENADSYITSLQPGDIFSYEYGEDDFLIVKVASITLNGTTATITGQETSLEEVFDYVKIDGAAGVGDAEIDNSNLEEGVEFVGVHNETEQSQNGELPPLGISAEGSNTKVAEYNFAEKKLGSDNLNVKINGGVSFKLKTSVKLYATWTEQYAEIKLDYEGKLSIAVSARAKGKIPIGYFVFKPVPCITIELTPSVVLDLKVKIEISGTLSGTLGFSADGKNGIQNISTTPKFDTQLKIEAKVFLGFSLEPKIKIICEQFIELGLKAQVGAEVTGKLEYSTANSTSASMRHFCGSCIDGEIAGKFELEAEAKFLKLSYKKTFELSLKICDFYYSFDFNEFAFKECPHKGYKTIFTVYGTDNNPASEARLVLSNGTELTTDKNGRATVYLSDSLYSITASKNGNSSSRVFRIEGKPVEISIDILKTYNDIINNHVSPDDIDYYLILYFGFCGNNLDWFFDESGTLTISGTGSMTDWSLMYNRAPWFAIRDEIKKVIIKSGVTNIGDCAFDKCTNITSVTIPSGISSIGRYAFSQCKNLKSITIPNSVTNIDEYAFSDCGITKITIPNSVTNIGEQSFEACANLTNIYVNNNNKYYSDISGVLFNKNKTKLLVCPRGKRGSYTIPNSVTSIGELAFSGCENLTSISIPNSVTNIGKMAFHACTNLTNINLPNKLKEIPFGIFDYCENLTNITIPNSVTKIGEQAFINCYNLTSIHIPNSVTSIGDSAFSECKSITNISIPNSVKHIGEQAFSGCDGITSITIPDTVTSFGNGIFYSCNGLIDVTTGNTISEGMFAYCSNLKNITISDNVASIGDYAFQDCDSITNITIPNGVQTIGDFAFFGCLNLASMTLSKSVISIGDYAFTGCSSPMDIYYSGTPAEWNRINIGNHNDDLSTAFIHFNGSDEYDYLDEYPSLPSQPSYSETPTPATEIITEPTHLPEINNSVSENVEISDFNNLIPSVVYNFYILNSNESESLLDGDNLLYIAQGIADSDGKLSFSYMYNPHFDNAEKYAVAMHGIDISDAIIELPNLVYNGEEQFIVPVVKYNNQILTNGLDYLLCDDYSATNIGHYTVTVCGLGQYSGEKSYNYRIVSGDLVTRLAGTSRVDTSLEVATEGWDSADTVILTNGYNFADALAGGPLSYALDAPILLTANRAELEQSVIEKINELGATKVIILGGVGAVNENIEATLAADFEVERVYGASRFDTAVAIAEKLAQVNGEYSDSAFVAYGYNYPDALAASSVAAISGTPILFAKADGSFNDSTANYISDNIVQNVTILGGVGAVGAGAEDNLAALGASNVERVFGTSRYDTAFAIVSKYSDLFTGDDIVLATGASFPDALAGGAFAAKIKAPVILVHPTQIANGVLEYIADKDPATVYVLGGTGAVADSTVDKFISLID